MYISLELRIITYYRSQSNRNLAWSNGPSDTDVAAENVPRFDIVLRKPYFYVGYIKIVIGLFWFFWCP